ncbi:MAG: hypothetical protein ACK5M7_03720 [Draconibacterium sp.]
MKTLRVKTPKRVGNLYSPEAQQPKVKPLFSDNRPEAATQRKFNAMARQSSAHSEAVQLKQMLNSEVNPVQKVKDEDEELLQGKFVTTQLQKIEEEEPLQGKWLSAERPKTPERSNTGNVVQLAIKNRDESAQVNAWVTANANNQLSRLSPDSVTDAPLSKAVRLRWFSVVISGKEYLVGLNIHYGGAFGALWVKNNSTQETNEYHPHAAPQHGLNPATLSALQLHIYEYDPVLHYKATHPEPDDGDWDAQFSG